MVSGIGSKEEMQEKGKDLIKDKVRRDVEVFGVVGLSLPCRNTYVGVIQKITRNFYKTQRYTHKNASYYIRAGWVYNITMLLKFLHAKRQQQLVSLNACCTSATSITSVRPSVCSVGGL